MSGGHYLCQFQNRTTEGFPRVLNTLLGGLSMFLRIRPSDFQEEL